MLSFLNWVPHCLLGRPTLILLQRERGTGWPPPPGKLVQPAPLLRQRPGLSWGEAAGGLRPSSLWFSRIRMDPDQRLRQECASPQVRSQEPTSDTALAPSRWLLLSGPLQCSETTCAEAGKGVGGPPKSTPLKEGCCPSGHSRTLISPSGLCLGPGPWRGLDDSTACRSDVLPVQVTRGRRPRVQTSSSSSSSSCSSPAMQVRVQP